MSDKPLTRRRAYALAWLQLAIVVFGLYGALEHSDRVLFCIILGLAIAYFAIVPFKRYPKDDPPTWDTTGRQSPATTAERVPRPR